MPSGWSIIVHGGCKPLPPEAAEAHQAGCRAAVLRAAHVLGKGCSAVDAVEEAIVVLEKDPTFNAGVGAVRNANGDLETDAALMDGETLDIGAVAAAPGLLNPIRVARGLLNEKETLLVSYGAKRYAARHGLGRFEPRKSPQPETATSCDTVGCVVRDGLGRIAAGTSTGGLTGKAEGRVGDSPLPGCGLYADSAVAGVSLSGDGEFISRALLAGRVVWDVEHGGDIQAAVERALARLQRIGGEAGIIGIDCRGRIGWAHRGAQFAVGWMHEHGEPMTALSRESANV